MNGMDKSWTSEKELENMETEYLAHLPRRKISEEAEEEGEAQNDEPDDMEEKERLAGDEPAAAVPDGAGSPLGDTDAGARRLRAAAPVRDAVGAADGVRPEAVDAAG